MNKGVELNKQTQMLPIVGILEEEVDKNCFLSALAEKLQVQVDEILDYELNLYNADRAEKIGLHEEFLSAPRLDNLTSVQALVDGILEGERKEGLNVIAIFDHEEVGSRTKQGAGSRCFRICWRKFIFHLEGLNRCTRMHLRRGF